MSESPDDSDSRTIVRNTRFGLVLFAIYVVLYGGFVALSAFWPDVMARDVGGVNLAVAYGFLLIIAAFVLALVYMAGTTRRAEDRA